MDEIKRIYLGLPPDFSNKVFWVSPPYRTNTLSRQAGGCDIVVEYQSRKILGYDLIKYPDRYFDAILETIFKQKNNPDFHLFEYKRKLLLIKSIVFKIYGRKYTSKSDYLINPFKEIWNSENASTLPSENLKELSFFKRKIKKIDFTNNYENDYYSSDDYFEYLEEEKYRESINYYENPIPVLKPLNLRKQKKEKFLSNYNSLSEIEKLRCIAKSGKPISYYPNEVSKIEIKTLLLVSIQDRNIISEKIRSENNKQWYSLLTKIESINSNSKSKNYKILKSQKTPFSLR